MNRQEKADLVSSIRQDLLESNFIILLHYRGLSDKQLYDFRTNLKSQKVRLKIAKNTLVKVAIKDTKLDILTPYLSGPTALAYTNDPVALAKVVTTTAKGNELLKVQAGCLNNAILAKEAIEALSKLGSLEEVRAAFIGKLNGVQAGFVRVLNAPASTLNAVLKNYASSKSEN